MSGVRVRECRGWGRKKGGRAWRGFGGKQEWRLERSGFTAHPRESTTKSKGSQSTWFIHALIRRARMQ